jgi:hypothetical protein
VGLSDGAHQVGELEGDSVESLEGTSPAIVVGYSSYLMLREMLGKELGIPVFGDELGGTLGEKVGE